MPSESMLYPMCPQMIGSVVHVVAESKGVQRDGDATPMTCSKDLTAFHAPKNATVSQKAVMNEYESADENPALTKRLATQAPAAPKAMAFFIGNPNSIASLPRNG